MAIVGQKAITAENQWSEKFFLSGSGSSFPGRSALVCATRDDSTVTLRRYGADGTTVIASLDLGSVMEVVEVPVQGLYDIGVATGNYGAGAVTITVEQ